MKIATQKLCHQHQMLLPIEEIVELQNFERNDNGDGDGDGDGDRIGGWQHVPLQSLSTS